MAKGTFIGALVVLVVGGVMPMGFLLAGSPLSPFHSAALTLVGWALAALLLALRYRLITTIRRSASSIGLSVEGRQIEEAIRKILGEIERKNSALALNLVEGKISSKEELSKALEKIVTQAFKLLRAESAELALFDKATGAYHASFVLGKPFRTSAQAMLSGAADSGVQPDYSPDVMIHPIAFAGNVLGSLRIGLKKGELPTLGDQEIVKLLALQGSLAVVNGEFVAELLKMRQASEESIKVKTGFLANLSHELRGPLGIIMNAVELVLDELCGPVTDDQRDTLSMVRQNGEHLLELVNDVLDYAKVESGKIAVTKVDIPVEDLLKDIGAVVRGQAEAKKHRLAVRTSGDHLVFSCDRRHARQMLINMLTNAIKYTPDGGSIEVWAERIPGNKIKVNVRDTGVGIDASDRSKVFAAFERVEHSYSLKQAGTGLGMPLTQRLAEVNGGSIDFLSVPGQGSHFWLIFPSAEPHGAMLAAAAQSDLPVSGNGKLILVVAESDGERVMMHRYLGHVGFVVTVADSIDEARRRLVERGFDLVIVDNNITDSFKYEIADDLRSAAGKPSLPIVLVSSRAFVFDIEKQLRLGVDRYLTKPIQLDELGRICQEIVEGEARVLEKAKSSRAGRGVILSSTNKETLH